MSGRPHLAQAVPPVSHLSALGTTVLTPAVSFLNTTLGTMSVTPAPTQQSATFENVVEEQGLRKTR